MRHTLLPLHERIVLRREYYRRVTIVFCFTFSFAIIVGIAALFPTFLKSVALRADAERAVESAQNQVEDKNLKEIQKSVARSLSLLDSLSKDRNYPKISHLIENVLNIRDGITFTSFSASRISTSTFSMSIQGIALSRNALRTFKSNFENLLPGNKVDLPISELVKTSNFRFSIQLKEKIQ